MFHKILIANRGEIACRIIKTARSMGIYSVAVYSQADTHSLHVRMADSACFIGDAPATESYLNIERIIHAAKETGAQAIHPGYGFLSENPGFAKACEAAGIIFIGPSISAMEAMASKQLAKQLLEKTNVPLTPGYHGALQSEQELLIEAKKIGFPVLLKAANGGGGKGMRAVYSESEFSAALSGAKRESQACFSDDTMIIEKLVQNPRHIEVQIMADNHGNVVHLFERDCSIQRRHQKIIEEAPAPKISSSLRQKLTTAACDVARSIQYRGAGTIEFLVDAQEHFYFMEMNTRLQVEHPVTEMITGLDLVAWQLKIAANEPLPLKQEDIKMSGHAIECRIYAEDPYQGFMPSIGRLDFLKEPVGDGIRIDTGVSQHSSISMYYDPMIAKLIAYGASREEALLRISDALGHYFIAGVKTNIPFLQAICAHSQFKNCMLSTDFLTKEVIKLPHPNHEFALMMAVSFDYINLSNKTVDPLLQDAFSWQMLQKSHWIWRYEQETSLYEIEVSPVDATQFTFRLNNTDHHVCVALQGDELCVETSKQKYKATIYNQAHALCIYTTEGALTINRFSWSTVNNQSPAHIGQMTAPMPSTVVAILKIKGDLVKAGERLMILEAMKMEHTIHAPVDGVLSEIFYSVGAQVNEGAQLLSLTQSSEDR